MSRDLSRPVADWPDEQLTYLAKCDEGKPIWNVRRALAAEVLRLREELRAEAAVDA